MMDVIIGDNEIKKVDKIKIETPLPQDVKIEPVKQDVKKIEPIFDVSVAQADDKVSSKQLNIIPKEPSMPKQKIEPAAKQPDTKMTVIVKKDNSPTSQQFQVSTPEPEDIKLPESPETAQTIISTPFEISTKVDNKEFTIMKDNKNLNCRLIYYMQGDEDELQEEILKFFLENPKIIYQINWTVGIATYFMFIYR